MLGRPSQPLSRRRSGRRNENDSPGTAAGIVDRADFESGATNGSHAEAGDRRGERCVTARPCDSTTSPSRDNPGHGESGRARIAFGDG
jgi:hypothetical protein